MDNKPTQAQIEAARLAIAAERDCDLPCACDRNPQPNCHDCMTMAIAALTAAAEVGEPNPVLFLTKQLADKQREIERLGAAFQCYVDEQQKDRKEIARLKTALSFYVENGTMGPADLKLATIERCAQAADDMAYVEACADDTAWGTANAAPYRKVAAAIRALKDKP